MKAMADLFFGYHMPNYTYSGAHGGEVFDRFVEQATAAEAAGFDMVTVMDHFYQIRGVGPETEPMMEAYTTLGAIAARTSRVKLATMVSGVTYRNPALLAKMATTLDVISKGRAIFGIGAAWNDSEHAGYGFEFPPIGEREDRLEEAVTIAKLMFTQDRPSFEGKHYRIDRALNVPRPVQPGGPKILIGGGGELRTLRILARHGDMGHLFGGPIDALKHKRDVFLRHCETEGRDPSKVRLLMGTLAILVENPRDAKAQLDRIPDERRAMVIVATPAEVADRLQPFIDAGFGGFTLSNQTLPTKDAIALGGELIKLLSGARSAA